MKKFLPILIISANAQGQSALPNPEETNQRLLPDEKMIRGEYEYKKSYTNATEQNELLKSQLAAARNALGQALKDIPDQAPSSKKPIVKSKVRRDALVPSSFLLPATQFETQPTIQTFAVTDDSFQKTTLPLGSYVKVKVLSGVEANTLEPYPVLLQADYAFTGPNHTRIDLSNCFFVAKAKANLSTERVVGETTEMSCVRQNGEHVRRAAKGYIAGEDSTFGMTGQLMSKQGQVLLAAVLANLAKGAGEAVGAAQTTNQVLANTMGTEKITNVTGSKTAFIAGSATANAASQIATWYLDYAKQLVPSIAVGSGRSVWVVMIDSVEVPQLDSNNGDE